MTTICSHIHTKFCNFPVFEVQVEATDTSLYSSLQFLAEADQVKSCVKETFPSAIVNIVTERRTLLQLVRDVSALLPDLRTENFEMYQTLRCPIDADCATLPRWVDAQMKLTNILKIAIGALLNEKPSLAKSICDGTDQSSFAPMREKVKKLLSELTASALTLSSFKEAYPKRSVTQLSSDVNVPIVTKFSDEFIMAPTREALYLYNRTDNVRQSFVSRNTEYVYADCKRQLMVCASSSAVRLYKVQLSKNIPVTFCGALDEIIPQPDAQSCVKLKYDRLLTGNTHGTVSIFHINASELKKERPLITELVQFKNKLAGATKAIFALDTIADRLALGSSDKKFQVWSIETNQKISQITHNRTVTALKMLSTDISVVGDKEGVVRLYDTRSPQMYCISMLNIGASVTDLTWLDDKSFFVSSDKGEINLYDTRAMRSEEMFNVVSGEPIITSMDLQGREFIYGTAGGVKKLDFV